MFNTPLPYHLPAQSGAITGHVMTDAEIEAYDSRIIRAHFRRAPPMPTLAKALPPRNLH